MGLDKNILNTQWQDWRNDESEESKKKKKRNKKISLLVSVFLIFGLSSKYVLAVVNPADTAALAAIYAQVVAIGKQGLDMIKLYNEQINNINNVFKAADVTKQFVGQLINPKENIFYVQGKQIADYLNKNFANNNPDPFKIRLRTFDVQSQALVKKYGEISSGYNVTQNAWMRAFNATTSTEKLRKINQNPSDSAYIYAGNQRVNDLYYQTKILGYAQEINHYEDQVTMDGLMNKLPKDKSEKEVFYDTTKYMSIKMQLDELRLLEEIHSTLVTMVQIQSGHPVTAKNATLPSEADFKTAYDNATKGLSLIPKKVTN